MNLNSDFGARAACSDLSVPTYHGLTPPIAGRISFFQASA